jgi:hypothetical protein
MIGFRLSQNYLTCQAQLSQKTATFQAFKHLSLKMQTGGKKLTESTHPIHKKFKSLVQNDGTDKKDKDGFYNHRPISDRSDFKCAYRKSRLSYPCPDIESLSK